MEHNVNGKGKENIELITPPELSAGVQKVGFMMDSAMDSTPIPVNLFYIVVTCTILNIVLYVVFIHLLDFILFLLFISILIFIFILYAILLFLLISLLFQLFIANPVA